MRIDYLSSDILLFRGDSQAALATAFFDGKRALLVDLVRRVIRSWDTDTLSRKLELHVGRDLQYIRINGTLVGGLVGLVLHAVSLAF